MTTNIAHYWIDSSISKMDESGPIIIYEPDPRHVELLLEHLEPSGTKSKGVSTLGEKSALYHDDTELEKSKVTLHISCVMRLAYLSVDPPHLQFCAKPTGAWNVPTHEMTLESTEKSYTVSEDTRTIDSRTPTSRTGESD